MAIIIWILVFFGIFYFLAIRPQRRQRQAHDELIASLETGATIVTIGGLFGTITCIGDDWVELAVAKRTRIRFLKRAISSVAESSGDEDQTLIEAADEGLLEDETAAEEAKLGTPLR